MVIAADQVQDFADGLTNSASVILPLMSRPMRILAVWERRQPGRSSRSGWRRLRAGRPLPGAGDGADELFRLPMPGQVFLTVFQGFDHAFQIIRQLALARSVDVFFREFAQRLFVDIIAFVP